MKKWEERRRAGWRSGSEKRWEGEGAQQMRPMGIVSTGGCRQGNSGWGEERKTQQKQKDRRRQQRGGGEDGRKDEHGSKDGSGQTGKRNGASVGF